MNAARKSAAARTDQSIGGLLRVGVIDSVDLEAATAIVTIGEITSPPLQWLTRTGDISQWAPPSEGEQVALIVPENDLEQAVIIGALFSAANPAVESTLRAVLRFADGAEVSYDPEASELNLDLPGRLKITAADGIVIDGDVEITGKLTASDDVIAAGKSLKTHRHIGVSTGSGVSGAPQ